MFHRFDQRPAAYLLLVALWAILCLPNLGGPSLWDIDEGNNAECFREMLDSGNLIVPTFNYQLRTDKPVLIYWLQIASAQLVGVNEWSARLPSALAALLTVWAVYELGRRMFTSGAALLAAVALATSFAFLSAAHFANPDALLLAFSTLALTFFWSDYQSGGKGSLVAVGVAAGLAVLAKGPVGLLLPAGVAGLFLLWQRRLRYLIDVRVVWFLLAFLLTAAPWYALVAAETKGAWIRGFWTQHHAARMTTALEGHAGPFYYYLPVLLAGLAPWSVVIVGTAWHAWRRLRDGDEGERAAVRLLVVWIGVYVLLFSFVRTKLPNYILPAYPALALLTGQFLDRWRRGDVAIPTGYFRLTLVALALLGAGISGGMLILAGVGEWGVLRGRAYPALLPWAWVGLIPMVAAALAWWLLERGHREGVIVSLVLAAVALPLPVLAAGLDAIDREKAPRELAKTLPADQLHREVRLASFDWFQPSLVFYTRREVVRVATPAEVGVFLRQPLPAYLFVPEISWDAMTPLMPANARIVGRKRDLYTNKVIVVVTNEASGERFAKSATER